jgi:ABC-type glycerol-3-phosphate transport system substrate-binding protein
MKHSLTIALVTVAVLGLAACATGTQAPQSAPQQPASPIPNVGFSPDVSNAAITACRNALDAQTDGTIDVVGSEYSEANVVVYMTVGANRAPWKCFTANDGRYANTELMGSEGAL